MTDDAASATAPPMPFDEFLAHLRARRAGATKLFASIFAVALLLAALMPPRFYATAKLAVLPSPEFTVRPDAGSHEPGTSAVAMDQIMKAETAILESQELHAATLVALGPLRLYPALDRAAAPWAIRMLRPLVRALLSPWRVSPPDSEAARMEQALNNFAGDLRVLPAKDANVIEVTFGHGNGALAALTVNDLLARYAQRREKLYDDPQLAVVRREAAQSGQAVKDADAALAAFKAAHAISDYAAERDLLVRRQSETTQAGADAAAAVAEQQARAAMLDRQMLALPKNVGLYQENDTDTRLQSVDTSLLDLRGQLAAARVHYRDDSRKVTDLLTQLHAREADRQTLAANPAPSLTRAGRSPALDSLLLDRARAATEQAAAAARAAALAREQRDIASRLVDLNAEDADLAELQRRRSVADAAFATASQVLAERRMTEAEDALRLANVRVIQPARTPLHAAPTPLFVVLTGAVLGGMAAAAWSVAPLMLRPTPMTAEGLAQATGLPVLGVFPADSARQCRKEVFVL